MSIMAEINNFHYMVSDEVSHEIISDIRLLSDSIKFSDIMGYMCYLRKVINKFNRYQSKIFINTIIKGIFINGIISNTIFLCDMLSFDLKNYIEHYYTNYKKISSTFSLMKGNKYIDFLYIYFVNVKLENIHDKIIFSMICSEIEKNIKINNTIENIKYYEHLINYIVYMYQKRDLFEDSHITEIITLAEEADKILVEKKVTHSKNVFRPMIYVQHLAWERRKHVVVYTNMYC